METNASEKQLARIIQLVSRSTIPPIYHETLINSLHTLSADQAECIGEDLARLLENHATYEAAATAWLDTWETIARRIESRLAREVLLIEHEVEELLREGALRRV